MPSGGVFRSAHNCRESLVALFSRLLWFNMSLLTAVPRSTSSASSKRNSARLDLLTAVLNSPQTQKKPSSSDSDSPRDSLSPLDDCGRDEFQDRGRSRCAVDIARVEDPFSDGNRDSQIVFAINGKQQLTICTTRSKFPRRTYRARTSHHLPGIRRQTTRGCLIKNHRN